jgi:hypothetical protein
MEIVGWAVSARVQRPATEALEVGTPCRAFRGLRADSYCIEAGEGRGSPFVTMVTIRFCEREASSSGDPHSVNSGQSTGLAGTDRLEGGLRMVHITTATHQRGGARLGAVPHPRPFGHGFPGATLLGSDPE